MHPRAAALLIDRLTLPTGQVIHQMKIYRVENGLITHDWTAYEQPQ